MQRQETHGGTHHKHNFPAMPIFSPVQKQLFNGTSFRRVGTQQAETYRAGDDDSPNKASTKVAGEVHSGRIHECHTGGIFGAWAGLSRDFPGVGDSLSWSHRGGAEAAVAGDEASPREEVCWEAQGVLQDATGRETGSALGSRIVN